MRHPITYKTEYGNAAAPRFLDITIAFHAARVRSPLLFLHRLSLWLRPNTDIYTPCPTSFTTQASPFGARTHMIKGVLSPAADEVEALCPVWHDPDERAGGERRPYR